MNIRWMICVLIAGGVAAAGTAEDDLKFAQNLGARGLEEMANAVLDGMIKSSYPAKQRAGRYGKALITKQQAQIAVARFIRALETGATPPVKREDVLKLFEQAVPEIQAYVKSQPAGSEAAFLLAATLQEFAEFLVGSTYPDSMQDQRAELVTSNKDTAEKLFEQAMSLYNEVAAETLKKAGGKVEEDSPEDIRITNAKFNEALASYRLAIIYPKGARFNARSEDAIEKLDTFYGDHWNEIVGLYAQLYLGQINYHLGIRAGDADNAEDAINYFDSVIQQGQEDPQYQPTIDVLAEAFYRYGVAANALASARGELKRKDPTKYTDAIRMARVMREKLRYGAKSKFGLLALLEVADAHAARGEFDKAVGIAGEVLTKARAEQLTSVIKTATLKLTNWVAGVGGSGGLPPGLLAQIGDSLAAEGNTAKAITFYENAIAASTSPEDIEQVALDARKKIATAYRKDRRYFAGGVIAWQLVKDFQKSGEGSDTGFYQIASEACWQAAQCYKQIAEATKRGSDKSLYDEVIKTFRASFPDHPQNADAAYSEALDFYTKAKYEEAASRFLSITQNSPSYWSAQMRVPLCYRRLATETDKDNAKKWHEQCLKASTDLYAKASKRGDLPRAQNAARTAMISEASALHSLQRWKEANTAIDAFFTANPGKFPRKGFEYKIKIDALLALDRLADAEIALDQLKKSLKGSGYAKRLNLDVYRSLRAKYKPMGGSARAALAKRAARLWQERVDATPAAKQSATDFWFLGDVLRDARDWEAAASAYEAAAAKATKPTQKASWNLLAAEMAFENARLNKDKMDPTEYRKTLDRTRELYTQVLIPDAENRKKLIPILASGAKWPSKAQWRWIAGKPGPLLTAAKVFGESSPRGRDGRWIGVRLVHRLHKLTRPMADPGTKMADFVNIYWEGAELKLVLYLAIASSQSDVAWSKKAAKEGYSFATNLIATYEKMDGPERVTMIKGLAKQLAAMR